MPEAGVSRSDPSSGARGGVARDPRSADRVSAFAARDDGDRSKSSRRVTSRVDKFVGRTPTRPQKETFLRGKVKHDDPLGDRARSRAVGERDDRAGRSKGERERTNGPRKGRKLDREGEARREEDAARSKWECILLSKHKVKWQRIYVGIKVQLFGTICIT